MCMYGMKDASFRNENDVNILPEYIFIDCFHVCANFRCEILQMNLTSKTFPAEEEVRRCEENKWERMGAIDINI